MLLALLLAAPAPEIIVEQAREPSWRPSAADNRAVLAATRSWFAARDQARYGDAYAMLSEGMKAAAPFEDWREAARRFGEKAGTVRDRRITRLSWYVDPPSAPAPGLYVAADFSADFADLEFVCGYVVWHREADGAWRVVREEQNILDRADARAVNALDRPRLRERMGCRD